jgi:hypothetical protein
VIGGAQGQVPSRIASAWSGVQSEEPRHHNYYDHDADNVEDIHGLLRLRREFSKVRRLNHERLGQKHVPPLTEFIHLGDGVVRKTTNGVQKRINLIRIGVLITGCASVKADGRKTLATKSIDQPIDRAA